jgi:hypothetical protein
MKCNIHENKQYHLTLKMTSPAFHHPSAQEKASVLLQSVGQICQKLLHLRQQQ